MWRHELILPKIEIDWSIPPEAVPTSLSKRMHLSTNYYFAIYLTSFAEFETNAEQTQKADELETPAAQGMLPSIRIWSPFTYFYSTRSKIPAL